MALEIVDLPIKNGGSFHRYVNVYQRVDHWIPFQWEFQDPKIEVLYHMGMGQNPGT